MAGQNLAILGTRLVASLASLASQLTWLFLLFI
jgi:hypothetical protein